MNFNVNFLIQSLDSNVSHVVASSTLEIDNALLSIFNPEVKDNSKIDKLFTITVSFYKSTLTRKDIHP